MHDGAIRTIQLPRRFVREHWGGTETVVLETAKSLCAAGHETLILCPCMLSTPGPDVMESVPIVRVPYFYPYFGLSHDAAAQLDEKGGNAFSWELVQMLLNYPDLQLIHLHTGKRLGGIARYAARRRHIPYVMTLHGGLFDVPEAEASSWTAPTRHTLEWGRALGWWVGARRVVEDAAAVICLGPEERAQVQARYPEQRVEIVPNGVNAARFAEGDGPGFRAAFCIPPAAQLLLNVGRIDPQKNQLFLLRALRALLPRVPHAHVALIGPVTNAAYAESVRRYIAEADLAAHVTLITGFAPDDTRLVDAYHAADLFVLPSVHEPFGIVVLEAWAAGLAVVAARVGGVPALVGADNRRGVLCAPDDEAAFLSAIQMLLDDPVHRTALGMCGRETVHAHYTWEQVTQRLIAIYEDVLP